MTRSAAVERVVVDASADGLRLHCWACLSSQHLAAGGAGTAQAVERFVTDHPLACVLRSRSLPVPRARVAGDHLLGPA